MNILTVGQLGPSTKATVIVDKFQERDRDGKYLYDRLVFIDFRFTGRSYLEYGRCIGLIIDREIWFQETQITFTAIKSFYCADVFQKYYGQAREAVLRLGKGEEQDILFEPDEAFVFKAQSSYDRSGFYKYYDSHGNEIMSKNYGDCSNLFKIVGLHVSYQDKSWNRNR